MKRSSAIISAIAATGVTLTLSLATLAMVAATSQPSSPIETLTLAQPAVADPEFATESLPDLPAIADLSVPTDDVAQAQAVPQPAAPQPAVPATSTTAKPKAKAKAKVSKEPTASASSSPQAQARALITPDQAVAAVVSATPGKVNSVDLTKRNGIDAYAVQLQRTDKSVVTGYVDQSSGVVFDWVVNQKAPKPATPEAAVADDYQQSDDRDDDKDDDHEGDDNDKDDKDKDDKNKDDKHEGDNDDD